MKLTNTFTKGIMNKDLDERLVPNGQYRDGQNIGVSTSEESSVGSIENILGNTEVGSGYTFTVNAVTIGAYADDARETIYWLVADTDYDYVIEQLRKHTRDWDNPYDAYVHLNEIRFFAYLETAIFTVIGLSLAFTVYKASKYKNKSEAQEETI